MTENFPEHHWSEKQQALLNAVLEAHAKSAQRNNISTNVMLNVARGSGHYCNAMAAAILSIGDAHAPVEEVMNILSSVMDEGSEKSMNVSEQLQHDIIRGKMVPGWGNSFIKGHDPVWNDVLLQIMEGWPHVGDAMDSITGMITMCGKSVFPNPACYTAACAIILNIPKEVAAWIFIEGRLRTWTDAFLRQQHPCQTHSTDGSWRTTSQAEVQAQHGS